MNTQKNHSDNLFKTNKIVIALIIPDLKETCVFESI